MAGCSGLPVDASDRGASTAVNAEQFGSALLPAGSKINHSQSLMLGSGDSWVGRVVLELGQSANDAYIFFLEQYPPQGWSLISAVRGKSSLLVFVKADRSATVEISEGSLLSGSMATLTITPKNAMAAPAKKL